MLVLALFVTTLVVGAAPPTREVGLAVLPARAVGMPPDSRGRIDAAFDQAAAETFGGKIIKSAEARDTVGGAALKDAAGCDTAPCFAKVGKALGVKYMLAVKATRAGAGANFAGQVIDLAAVQVVALFKVTARGDADTYLEAAREMTAKILDRLPALEPGASPPEPAPAAAAEPAVTPPAVAVPPIPIARELPVPTPTPTPTPQPVATGPAPTVTELHDTETLAAPGAPEAQAPPPAAAPSEPAAPAKAGWIGLKHRPLSREDRERAGLSEGIGTAVAAVSGGGPADVAGVLLGDVILEANGVRIDSPERFAQVARGLDVGAVLTLLVKRRQEQRYLAITAGARPDAAAATPPVFVAPIATPTPPTAVAAPAPIPTPAPTPTAPPPAVPLVVPTEPAAAAPSYDAAPTYPSAAVETSPPKPPFKLGQLLWMLGAGGGSAAVGVLLWKEQPPILGPALVTIGAGWVALGVLTSLWPTTSVAMAPASGNDEVAYGSAVLRLRSVDVVTMPEHGRGVAARFEF
ncbi:MAG: PDZ domain-containing protein [Deltaproteobacteria bacterium]|nr:PDZ domain-containing protein [Deltaproteobacteria bacterium]